MNTNQPAVTAHNLTKRFGDFTAVDRVSFDVRRGEIFGFLGPNGAGKTTTIRMMLGLLTPTSGSVDVLGVSVADRPAAIRPRVGYMAQAFSLYDDLTVIQNLRFYGRAYGLNRRELDESIGRALRATDLEGRQDTRTGDLSGGWRQRLALNAAILHRPELLFLDEPTAGVDPISRRSFWDLLYELVGRGVTVFVTTHYMDEAEHCHRLAFIRRGALIASGSPEEIKREHMTGRVLELAPEDTAAAVRVLRRAVAEGTVSLQEVAMYGPLVHVVAEDVDRLKAAIADVLQEAGVEPGRMTVIEPSLEDVFISAMK
jgi:ABC-2 type transport system ATP-binding protein